MPFGLIFMRIIYIFKLKYSSMHNNITKSQKTRNFQLHELQNIISKTVTLYNLQCSKASEIDSRPIAFKRDFQSAIAYMKIYGLFQILNTEMYQ